MFETEIFMSMFTKVFGGIALLVMITMPFVFRKMRYEGKQLGFMTIYKIVLFTFFAAVFAAHMADVYQGSAVVNMNTYLIGLVVLISGLSVCMGYFRYLFR